MNRDTKALTVIAIAVLVTAHVAPSAAFANLAPNIGGESVGTLPPGRFMVSAMYMFGSVASRYGDDGTGGAISDSLNRNISWQMVIDEEKERREQIAGLLSSSGVDSKDSAGNMVGKFDGTMQVTVPVLGCGITKKLGLFAAMPIIKLKANAAIAFQASESSKALMQNLQNMGQASVAKEFALSLNNGFEDKLKRAGYKFENHTERQMIGDLRLELPYVFDTEGRSFKDALTTTIVVPTAQLAPMDDVYQVSGGLKRWGVGVRNAYQFSFIKRAAVTLTGGVLAYLPVTQAKRIPQDAADQLPEEIDEFTRISTALSYQASAFVSYQMSRSWAAKAGMQHQEILNHGYSGDRYNANRYGVLTEKSGMRLDSASAQVEFSAVQGFLDGDFFMPGVITAGIGYPLLGRSSLSDATYMIQGIFFF